jgi:hypothetical protein
MLKTYRIRTGCSFRLDDTTVRTGGEIIELEDDVAASHADKIEPVAEEAPANPPADPPADEA